MPGAVDVSQKSSISSGIVGKIPVRNIWLLLLYASDLYRELGAGRIEFEENPDNIADLIAEFLIHHVEKRLRRNLSLGYQRKASHLRRVRGRIDLLETERHRLLLKGKVACKYYDLTINTKRNRFIKGSLQYIAEIVNRKELNYKCKTLANRMLTLGVTGSIPSLREITLERFGKYNIQDEIIVSAAKLAFELRLPTETAGEKYFAIPERDVVWFRNLFEKAIGGFYKVVLDRNVWIVYTGKRFKWSIFEQTEMIDSILPTMRTDIIIDNKMTNERIVIDTKFNEILTSGWYRDKTIRNSYLYQMYAYLRSQEKENDDLANNAIGILLHPSVGYSLDESVTIQGHSFRFITIDLRHNIDDIRKRLLSILD